MGEVTIEIERVHCNQCRQSTRDQLLSRVVYTETEELGEDLPVIDWEITTNRFPAPAFLALELPK